MYIEIYYKHYYKLFQLNFSHTIGNILHLKKCYLIIKIFTSCLQRNKNFIKSLIYKLIFYIAKYINNINISFPMRIF